MKPQKFEVLKGAKFTLLLKMGTFLGDFSAENDEVMIFLFDLQVQEAQFDYLSLGPCKENGFSTYLFNKQKGNRASALLATLNIPSPQYSATIPLHPMSETPNTLKILTVCKYSVFLLQTHWYVPIIKAHMTHMPLNSQILFIQCLLGGWSWLCIDLDIHVPHVYCQSLNFFTLADSACPRKDLDLGELTCYGNLQSTCHLVWHHHDHLKVSMWSSSTGWWFGTFFIFPYVGNNHPNWPIFFRGVQTTNQYMMVYGIPPDVKFDGEKNHQNWP